MYSPNLAPSAELPSASITVSREKPQLENLFVSQPSEVLESGEALFWEGDPASGVFLVSEGCLRLYRILLDGRRAIVGFVFAGELLALFSGPSYQYTAEAVTPVRLRRLRRHRFQELVDGSADLRSQMQVRMTAEVAFLQQHMVVIGQLSAEERVCSFLLQAACRTGADKTRPVVVELPMSRLDIADYLGLTIETVCRAFSKLKREGLITCNSRHTVVLKRMTSLGDVTGWSDFASYGAQPAPSFNGEARSN